MNFGSGGSISLAGFFPARVSSDEGAEAVVLGVEELSTGLLIGLGCECVGAMSSKIRRKARIHEMVVLLPPAMIAFVFMIRAVSTDFVVFG